MHRPQTVSDIVTPAFVVDRQALARNLAVLAEVKARTGCRVLLALKAFSMFAVFPQVRRVLDGCCASSPHEARLGREEFGGEVHAFAAAFSAADMVELTELVDHVTFNSFAQWRTFQPLLERASRSIACGLRINPEHSEGHTPLYDPCAPRSRLGIRRADFEGQDLQGIAGLHFHTLCEQNSDALERTLAAFEARFGDLLPRFGWLNLGGGHHVTRADYDVDRLCRLLNRLHADYGLQLYLEPGEAVALNAGTLVTTVLDVIDNAGPIAILDASATCHMPDVLEMPYRPRVFRAADWDGRAEPPVGADRGVEPGAKPFTFRLAGPSCLAGDVIGDYAFEAPLRPGDRLVFEDMAHYTMVKTSTFNGIQLPSILLREADGSIHPVRTFGYADFKGRLS